MNEDLLESCPFPKPQVVFSGVVYALHCLGFFYLKCLLFFLTKLQNIGLGAELDEIVYYF